MRSWIWRISAVVAGAWAALGGTAGAQSPLLTAPQFRDAYLEVVQKLAPDTQYRVDSDFEVVLFGAGGEARVFLGNAYDDYRRAPKNLDDLLLRQAKIALNVIGPETGIAEARLLVVVRSEGFLEGYEQAAAEAGAAVQHHKLLSRALPGQLAAIVVSDEGDSFRYPSTAELVETFGSVDRTWASALANTPRRIGAPRIEALAMTTAISVDDGLATSLLLMEDFWADFARSHPGRPVIFVAGKDLLLVADAGNADSMAQLKAMARDGWDHPDKFGEPVTPDLLAPGPEGWVVFETYPYE